MGIIIKGSTRRLFGINRWRVDRAVHGYICFASIDLYVKTLMTIARRCVCEERNGIPLDLDDLV